MKLSDPPPLHIACSLLDEFGFCILENLLAAGSYVDWQFFFLQESSNHN